MSKPGKATPNRGGHVLPPIDDPEMWKRVCNLVYWFERDEEYRWLKAVEAAVCTEEGKPSKLRGRAG